MHSTFALSTSLVLLISWRWKKCVLAKQLLAVCRCICFISSESLCCISQISSPSYSVSHEHEDMIGQHVFFHQRQLRLDSGLPASWNVQSRSRTINTVYNTHLFIYILYLRSSWLSVPQWKRLSCQQGHSKGTKESANWPLIDLCRCEFKRKNSSARNSDDCGQPQHLQNVTFCRIISEAFYNLSKIIRMFSIN